MTSLRVTLFWLRFVARVRCTWYRLRYGVKAGGWDGSMLPGLGRGKYVDVLRRGNFIDLIDHHDDSNPFTIRLIPYQPNHGVMVEYIDMNDNVRWRGHMDARKFLDAGMGVREVLKPLPVRKPFPKKFTNNEPPETSCSMKSAECPTQ